MLRQNLFVSPSLFFIVVRTFDTRSTLSTELYGYHTVLVNAISTMLYSKSQGLNQLSCIMSFMPEQQVPHPAHPPSLWQPPFYSLLLRV